MPSYPVLTSGRTPVAAVVEAAAAARKGTREGAKEGIERKEEGRLEGNNISLHGDKEELSNEDLRKKDGLRRRKTGR